MKLIQGFFAQRMGGLVDIAYSDNDVRKVICKALVPFMYAGALFDDGTGEWSGEMIDLQGRSKLYDVALNDSEVRFRKQYVRHEMLGPQACMLYRFDKREGNTWVGGWRHLETEGGDLGPARCIITDADEMLFRSDVLTLLKSYSLSELEPAKSSA